jgi:hypothetical protein
MEKELCWVIVFLKNKIIRRIQWLVVNLYIPHNRRTPLQAEEALGPISILGVAPVYDLPCLNV